MNSSVVRCLALSLGAALALPFVGCPDRDDYAPAITVEPNAVDFGAQAAGVVGNVSQNVVFTNEDDRDVTLFEIVFEGDTDVFSFTGTDGLDVETPRELAPGDTLPMTATFIVPQFDGDYAATATLTFGIQQPGGGCNCGGNLQEFRTITLPITGSATCDLDGDGVDGGGCEGTDCDDENPDIYPDADELCDGLDNDCDGDVDEGFDEDGDGYLSCEDDCDDTNDEINPDAEEICDGLDNDCDRPAAMSSS